MDATPSSKHRVKRAPPVRHGAHTVKFAKAATLQERVVASLMDLLGNVPSSREPESNNPDVRARKLTGAAAKKAALISGGAAFVPGPLGLLTLLGDLTAIWRLQAQLVSDIAAGYGKTETIGTEQMLYCLFKHSASHLVRELVVQAGERYLVKRAPRQVVQALLKKIGIKVAQRAVGKGFTRFVPVLGSAGVALYAHYDTKSVGETAIDLFNNL